MFFEKNTDIFIIDSVGHYVDGLVQDCSNSSADALELLQSFSKPSVVNLQYSLWPSDTIWPQIWVNIGSGNGSVPDDTKPLAEPVLTYHP